MKKLFLVLSLLLLPASLQAFQASISVPNGTGAQVRAATNSALQAVTTRQSGATAPAVTYPYMEWVDTSAVPAVLKTRNGANSAWITVGTITDAGGIFSIPGNAATATNADTVDNQHASAFATAAQGALAAAALPAATFTATYTAADVFAKVLTLDADTNGINAATLDGQEGAYYQPASTAITTANIADQSVASAVRLTGTNGDFPSSKGYSGYQKLPGGLIIQWGLVTADGAQTFPIPFPTACLTLTFGATGDSGGVPRSGDPTQSGFTYSSANQPSTHARYIAIGY